MSTTVVYLTVVSLPDGVDGDQLATLLAEASGLDAYLIKLRLRQGAPCIIGRYPIEPAELALLELRRRGGDGFLATMDAIEALGPTWKIRDLALEPDGLELTLWRGDPVVINPATIDVVVRGRASETQGHSGAGGAATLSSLGDAMNADVNWGWGGFHVGGSVGMNAGLSSGWSGWNAMNFNAKETKVIEQHTLDLHVRGRSGPRVFQIDGDKFGYEILGDLRGHSDNYNIDRMCELIVHLNPQVVVDPYFTVFRPPTGYKSIRLPMQSLNKDKPAFAFYSRWAALLYRHVLGT